MAAENGCCLVNPVEIQLKLQKPSKANMTQPFSRRNFELSMWTVGNDNLRNQNSGTQGGCSPISYLQFLLIVTTILYIAIFF